VAAAAVLCVTPENCLLARFAFSAFGSKLMASLIPRSIRPCSQELEPCPAVVFS
jgi:hypothetical protein